PRAGPSRPASYPNRPVSLRGWAGPAPASWTSGPGWRRWRSRWPTRSVRNGGSSYDTDRIAEVFDAAGLRESRRFPTVPGGPVLIAARRATD
ncbi:hypothetical protein OKJ48_15775, partial [Streptomyces kunmingensis]|nr:hypothetical protein [Streptomyces kunmingensis]